METVEEARIRVNPTRDAVVQCGKWLSACLELGWGKQELDFLEVVWWSGHDRFGNLTEGFRQESFREE